MSDKDFKLKSSSEGFDSRSKDIFANIDSLASASNNKQEKSKEKQPRNRDRSRDEVNNRHKTEEFKGRESIFRSPNESGWPPARSRHDRKRQYHGNSRGPRRTPDHIVNPNKYTKYDLSDVSKDQLSDRSNTRAAFDFLRQLKDRKREDDSKKDNEETDKYRKISFKKPFRKSSMTESTPTSVSGSVVRDGHKRIMPECVVGQKIKNSSVNSADKKTSEKPKNKPSKIISLSHLDDDNDEDSD